MFEVVVRVLHSCTPERLQKPVAFHCGELRQLCALEMRRRPSDNSPPKYTEWDVLQLLDPRVSSSRVVPQLLADALGIHICVIPRAAGALEYAPAGGPGPSAPLVIVLREQDDDRFCAIDDNLRDADLADGPLAPTAPRYLCRLARLRDLVQACAAEQLFLI